jgi:hypothetical protein
VGKGEFHETVYLLVGNDAYQPTSRPNDSAWFLPRSYLQAEPVIEFQDEQHFTEQIAFFIFGDLEKNLTGRASGIGNYFDIRLPEGYYKTKIELPLYFISTEKRIFQLLHRRLAERYVRLVNVDQIVDPDIAARIAAEIAAMK